MSAKPNIVLINCDDLGYGDLGCYGSRVNATPVLDRMAAEGVRFTDFYMGSPLCSPSRGAMLTGCYPPRIGFGTFEGKGVLFPGQGVGMSADERTLASLLKGQGYATQLVGKWHCGDQPEFLPTRHGFDGYFGVPYSNDMGRQAGRTHLYPPLPLMENETVLQQQPDQAALTERYVEHAVRFIRRNRERPFFLYLAHLYVHLPIYPPERFLKASRNGRYGAAVECIDWATGVLLDELGKLGLDRSTIVIFTSDNGSRDRDEGGSNAPLRGTKATTWEGGLRLPCLMRWPETIPAGTVCGELVASMDLLPTLVKLAGGEAPRDRLIDGKDVTPLVMGAPGARSPRDAFFYYLGNALEAVRWDRWKLHVNRRGEGGKRAAVEELYDLEEDVGETRDVAAANPDVVKRLQAWAAYAREDLGDEATGVRGGNVRPIGRVSDPRPLTAYDPAHPYFAAEYDLPDAG